MATLLLVLATFTGYVIAYHTYGRFLARRIFRVQPGAPVPSKTLEDGMDYVPTTRVVVFGHHFTSIAEIGRAHV